MVNYRGSNANDKPQKCSTRVGYKLAPVVTTTVTYRKVNLTLATVARLRCITCPIRYRIAAVAEVSATHTF